MSVKFTATTSKTFRLCGWAVDKSNATRVYGKVRLRVTPAGQWFAHVRNIEIGHGIEDQPSLAAMAANNFAYAYSAQQQEA